MKKLILLTAMLLTMTVGLAKDIKTLVVTTNPPMHCENCENKIKGNMRFEKGVRNVETDLETQHVTITYDSRKASVKTLQEGMKKIGYDTKLVSDQPQQEGKKKR